MKEKILCMKVSSRIYSKVCSENCANYFWKKGLADCWAPLSRRQKFRTGLLKSCDFKVTFSYNYVIKIWKENFPIELIVDILSFVWSVRCKKCLAFRAHHSFVRSGFVFYMKDNKRTLFFTYFYCFQSIFTCEKNFMLQ